jgi:hypothetical protein
LLKELKDQAIIYLLLPVQLSKRNINLRMMDIIGLKISVMKFQ